MQILGYDIASSYPSFQVLSKEIINTINPHSYCVAKNDLEFQEALKASDILIPDGIGIVWAAQFLKGKKIKRIAGADMHSYLLRNAQEHSLNVFYMGASQETLDKIENRINKEFPQIRVGSYSPPYKTDFSEEDSETMREKVNAFKPDILFIGMTAPKQEKWVYQNKEQLQANIICSIGAVFDFYAGTVKRSPEWLQKIGLEWLHRSFMNPTRLGKRNLQSNPKFVLEVIKAKISQKF